MIERLKQAGQRHRAELRQWHSGLLYWRHCGWHPGDLAGAEIGACRPHRRHEEIHLREAILAAIADQEMHFELLHREGRQPQRVFLQLFFPKVH
jgi:hypothetical protein